jgi:hypothetical protein
LARLRRLRSTPLGPEKRDVDWSIFASAEATVVAIVLI